MAREEFPTNSDPNDEFERIIHRIFDGPESDEVSHLVNPTDTLHAIELLEDEGMDMSFFRNHIDQVTPENSIFMVVADDLEEHAPKDPTEASMRITQAEWIQIIAAQAVVGASSTSNMPPEELLLGIEHIEPFPTLSPKMKLQIMVEIEKSLTPEWKTAISNALDAVAPGRSLNDISQTMKRLYVTAESRIAEWEESEHNFQEDAEKVIRQVLAGYGGHKVFMQATSYMALAIVESYKPIEHEEDVETFFVAAEISLQKMGLSIENPIVQEALQKAQEVLRKT